MDHKDFEKIFAFVAKLYQGNWQYRWGQVPFVDQQIDQSKGESVLSHQWSCVALWSLLRQIMPETDKIVHTNRVYELLTFHDLGEVIIGDTPLVQQLNEGSREKHEEELREVERYSEDLSGPLQEFIRSRFQEYTFSQEPTVEILLSRYINAMQGNHFGLVFGKNLAEHSELISTIVKKYFIPIVKDLQAALEKKSKSSAEEVAILTKYHLASIRGKGIRLEL